MQDNNENTEWYDASGNCDENTEWYDASGNCDENGCYDAGGHFYAERCTDLSDNYTD